MSFKDIIPWRRGRHEMPVHRQDEERGLAPALGDELGLTPFFRETESLFERFFRGFGATGLFPDFLGGDAGGAIGPPLSLDMIETEDDFRISVELPGVDEQDVDVSISGNVLTIRGEKRSEARQERADAFRLERMYGRFERSVPLPAEVDEDRVQAEFRRGVLEVTLPKSKRARPEVKRIAVRSLDE